MTSSNPDVFIHPLGVCESSHIGTGSRIWAFVHILPNARIGRECNICDGVFIENDVTVGDRVTVKPGVQLWDGVTLEDDVFVGPNATFANDMYPRSKERPSFLLKTLVKRGASIGANATILPGIVIGERAMVGAGTVVIRDVPAHAIVTGNPGRIVGYADTVSQSPQPAKPTQSHTPGQITNFPLRPTGCQLWRLPHFADLRGEITVAEFDRNLPFALKRIFFVYGVPSSEVRGEHAHRTCTQFLLPVNGAVSIVADDGSVREEIRLDNPNIGILIPPKIWTVQYHFTADAVLAVFCSENYDSQEYIRDYNEFLDIVGRSQRT